MKRIRNKIYRVISSGFVCLIGLVVSINCRANENTNTTLSQEETEELFPNAISPDYGVIDFQLPPESNPAEAMVSLMYGVNIADEIITQVKQDEINITKEKKKIDKKDKRVDVTSIDKILNGIKELDPLEKQDWDVIPRDIIGMYGVQPSPSESHFDWDKSIENANKDKDEKKTD